MSIQSLQVREAAYRIYLYPMDNLSALLERLLQKRHRLAELAGFPSYAHRVLRGTLAETPGNSVI